MFILEDIGGEIVVEDKKEAASEADGEDKLLWLECNNMGREYVQYSRNRGRGEQIGRAHV